MKIVSESDESDSKEKKQWICPKEQTQKGMKIVSESDVSDSKTSTQFDFTVIVQDYNSDSCQSEVYPLLSEKVISQREVDIDSDSDKDNYILMFQNIGHVQIAWVRY